MEWALDTDNKIFDGKTEAEFLSQSIADVSRHYGAGLLDQKTVDWANLIQCLALVYGGRLIAIKMTPRVKPPKPAPTPQQTARDFAQPATYHRTTPPPNNFVSNEPNVGTVAGVGDVEFPADHPLANNPQKLN